MDRSVWKRLVMATLAATGGGFASGCWGGSAEPLPPPPVKAPYTVSRPAVPASNRPEGEVNRRNADAGGAAKAEVSWDTERDRTFAGFLQKNSAGMIRKAAVGIENKGELKVEITRAVAPEDTLALTKSLLNGARSDFPDRPITLALYDPAGEPILKARFRPGEGVHYQIAHNGSGGAGAGKGQPPDLPRTKPAKPGDPIARGGVTERDQKFAHWAEEHGRPMLRYVEADLERHGRLWVGITRAVKPAEVKPLAQSLLEGARKEFPRGELVATVFDPDGERIGRAHFDSGGEVHWEK